MHMYVHVDWDCKASENDMLAKDTGEFGSCEFRPLLESNKSNLVLPCWNFVQVQYTKRSLYKYLERKEYEICSSVLPYEQLN
jgi:hypothetical protein